MFRPISIHAVLNGWVATVGCQTVVYTDAGLLLRDLSDYLRDPMGTEARMLSTAVNSKILNADAQPVGVRPNVDEWSMRQRLERDREDLMRRDAPGEPIGGAAYGTVGDRATTEAHTWLEPLRTLRATGPGTTGAGSGAYRQPTDPTGPGRD